MKTRKQYKFIHTINNKPATWDREQICYVDIGAGARFNAKPISFSQIKKEQTLSKKFRKKMGFKDSINYSYFKIDGF